jgi:perosamine synthetase
MGCANLSLARRPPTLADQRFIPVAAPVLAGNEKRYVLDCLDSNWISSNGKYIERFETEFAAFCGARYGIACTNGTAALHLALLAMGLGPGDEVIVPTLTFVATANAVTYCGARPVFVDSELCTWNVDPKLIEASITPRTKGIVVVHLYGHPADMDPILALARRHGLFLIEDAAEAHGAEYKGKIVGTFGDAGVFSFYGNKIITTGEGGIVVTQQDSLASKVRQLKGQGIDPSRRYWFPIVGYNYRMTNIAAAIGVAQLEKAIWHMERRREVAAWYKEELFGSSDQVLQPEQPWARHAYWMVTLVLADDIHMSRDDVTSRLQQRGIETRPVFYPMHLLPPYRGSQCGMLFPVAEKLSSRGFNVPTWAGLKREDVHFVCDQLKECLTESRNRVNSYP